MRSFQILGVALFATLAVACSSKPQIRSDQDRSVDLRDYKTFAFFSPVATDRSRYTTLLSSHLKEATRAELARHNYAYSEIRPDLRINFYLKVVERRDLHSMPAGRTFRGYSRGTYVDVVDTRQGTLVIEMVDVRRNALVWQGIAEGQLDDKAINNPGPAIDAIVSQIFATYPYSRS